MISKCQYLRITVMTLDRVDPFPISCYEKLLIYGGKCYFQRWEQHREG